MFKIYSSTSFGGAIKAHHARRTPLKDMKLLQRNHLIYSFHRLAQQNTLIRKKVIFLFCLFIGFLGAAQTEVYFKFDEAGNQRYRGPDAAAKQASDQSKTTSLAKSELMDEKTFWKKIRLYPVPVNDVLTIDWTEESDNLIESVSLYQHSTAHWKFQQQNLPGLNRQLKINMTGYDWGVYVLRFTLKDGRIFSKNITKR